MPKPPQRSTLSAFFVQEEPGTELAGARRLPLDLIDPNPQQARQSFDPAALAELAASIAAHGVLEPILVRPVGARYSVVAGERRTRAARDAGLESIPAIIRDDLSDQDAAYITAVENLQRQDLDLEDEARWLAYLQELTGLSERQLADQLGKHRNWVNRRLRMLRERPDLFAHIRAGALTQEAALGVLIHEQHLREGVSQPGTLPPADSEQEPEAEREPVERAELDSHPARGSSPPRPSAEPTPFRFRPFQQVADKLAGARSILSRLPALAVPQEDLPLVAQQLADLEAQHAQLGEQIAALRAALSED